MANNRGHHLGRLVVVLFLILAPVYFVVGAAAAALDLWLWTTYLNMGSIVGGLASVAGLIGVVRPALTVDDVRQLESGVIDDINRAAGELESLEKERLEARQDIDGLALQKKRLEVLVRKASLALFLKEQHSLYEKRVLEKLDESTELGSDLVELKRLKDQLNELEEEIENHEDVDLLNEIIRKAGRTTIAIDVFPRGSLLLQISRAVDSLLKGR